MKNVYTDVVEEYRVLRGGTGLIDYEGLGLFRVSGAGAGRFLGDVSTRSVDFLLEGQIATALALRDALDQQDPRVDHAAREVSRQHGIRRADVLDALGADAGLHRHDPVQQEEREPVGEQPGDVVGAERLWGGSGHRHGRFAST